MMIGIYSTASNAILDFTTPRIAILVNPTKKALKIDKSIYIATIHKYIDIVYLMVGSPRVFAMLTVASTAIFEPLLSI